MGHLLSRGDVVDRYEVEGFLGEGGLAEVFRVRHRDLHSVYALKVLAVDLPNIHERILAEGRVQAKLRHANVVNVHDVIDVRGRPGLVMEHIDGVSLRDWLIGHQPNLEEALHIFAGVLRGVRAAHRHGLAHRDLKPENILLAETELGLLPKVMDFGLVKVLDDVGQTQTGVMMGTPQYMAPEQIHDASRVDQRADLFSLGCILYGMVTGVPAFRGTDVVTILNKTANGDYPRPEVVRPELPDRVCEAINLMLEVDLDKRMQSCDQALDLLFPRRPASVPAPEEVEEPEAVEAEPEPEPNLHDLPTVPSPAPAPANRPMSPSRPMPAAAVGWLAMAAGVACLAAGVLVGMSA